MKSQIYPNLTTQKKYNDIQICLFYKLQIKSINSATPIIYTKN